ncbi:MAG: flagellar biosynthetic protein FliR [Planctomycetota bacterium]
MTALGLDTAGWSAGLLVTLRLLPMALWTPVLGGSAAPWPVRVGAAGVLGMVLGPAFGGAVSGVAVASWDWAALAGQELLIGAVLAWLVRLVFDAARASGALVDHARGGALVWAMTPARLPDRPGDWRVFERLAAPLALAVFAALGGLRALVTAIWQGLERAPVGVAWAMDASVGQMAIGWSSRLLEVALLVSAPWLVAALVIDLSMGVAGRSLGWGEASLASGVKSGLALVIGAAIGGVLAVPVVASMGGVLEVAGGAGWLGAHGG